MNLILRTTLLVFLFFVAVGVHSASRIIGGNPATEGQFPFLVALNVVTDISEFFCGGALIRPLWILTSCICTTNISNLSAVVGTINRDGNQARRVRAVLPYPKFNETTLENDIGLVQLYDPVEYNEFIQPIKLASIDNLPTTLKPTTVIGWGQTSDDDSNLAQIANYAELNVLTSDECKQTFGAQIVETMVCLKGDINEGTCYGDSGSPLVGRPIGSWDLEVLAVSSFFGANGCETSDPSGFTRVYPYLDWILENINGP